jgi:hypothetical protein
MEVYIVIYNEWYCKTDISLHATYEPVTGRLRGTCVYVYSPILLCLQKMKGLIRKRSTTAARLQRALSKTQRLGAGESPGDPANTQPPGNRDQGLPLSGQDKRQFLMEAPVQFSTVSSHWAIGISVP